MVIINDVRFYEVPCMCGACPAFFNGSTHRSPSDGKGICLFFDKTKGYYANVPKRCKQLFEKAITFPDGERLVITFKDRDYDSD